MNQYQVLNQEHNDDIANNNLTASIARIQQSFITRQQQTQDIVDDNRLSRLPTSYTLLEHFTGFLSAVAIVGLYVTLSTFSMVALEIYSYKFIANTCYASNMFAFISTCCILFIIQINLWIIFKPFYMYHIIVACFIFIWGVREVFFVDCVHKLDDTLIYYMSIIWIMIYLIILSVLSTLYIIL